ncbi:short-chain dehydrogenase [Acuticoccus sediminis]|uniref:Short-chain dehydrogenase n=1 Tax=Acuticoccus sediminis TaxID=2184697 RepID=A0A8B2NZT9_9HYPH|nr:SDR family NAD(P)-dependent oxidoreductase [Acuticoccus sediminis]RAI02080.1 short-chain dehydrogenase [Acuticoccus sediminis]
MAERLAQRVAIVTGGAGGIGGATGRVFCEEGASVLLVDPDQDALTDVVAGIRRDVPDAKVEGAALDVSGEDACVDAVARARALFGNVDILVNNAGIRSYEPLAEAKAETWDRVLAVNLLSYAYMAKAAMPDLRQAGNGAIVNISSTYGVTGRAGMGQYDATKAGIIAMTRTLAFEEAEHGVRANSLCPGYTLTPFHIRRAAAAGTSEADLRAAPVHDCIMKRWCDPREIAIPILWLASDEASYITATNLMVDGGRPVM